MHAKIKINDQEANRMSETNTIDSINELLSKLPESLRVKALHYVEYLSVGDDALLPKGSSQSGSQTFLNSLEPPAANKKRNGFGILKGKITIADDFDAPLEEFADYQ
jgi:hypothetical protein